MVFPFRSGLLLLNAFDFALQRSEWQYPMLRISVKIETFGNHPSVNSSKGCVFRMTEIDHESWEALSASATVFALEGGVCGRTALGSN
jgi:hypothetical protein